VRAGGKHNDLEQVGRTTRHHTFFEMLGNFSFGDYFKKEAIAWAWELVTSPNWFGIPKDKLYVTIFEGATIPHADIPRDTEAYDSWRSLDVPTDRIFALDMKDNFWQMGDTGPCGPCSEIHYDLGPKVSDLGHTDCKFPCECGRFVEIWNLVFMQYDREAGVKDGVSWHKFSPLPKPCVDTGMGVERVAAVLQGKISNYDTDLFRPLIEEASSLANVEYGTNHDTDVSVRIIADHARAAAFLISDGVLPSNEGRGYVLRLILRRALYHGQTLGLNEPFLFKLAGEVVAMMKDAYPELVEAEHHIAKTIKVEEERYAHSTRIGLEKLYETSVWGRTEEGNFEVPFAEYIKAHASPEPTKFWEITGAAPSGRAPAAGNLPLCILGEDLFKLHDTFGLRPDFVEDVVRNYPIRLDWFGIRPGGSEPSSPVPDKPGYQMGMERQRARARASWKAAEKKIASPLYLELAEKHPTKFDGHDQITSAAREIIALVQEGRPVSGVKAGAEVGIIIDRTPFYAEAGGQVGDSGRFFALGTYQEVARIHDTYYPVAGLIVHKGTARESLRVGDWVNPVVDAERRDAIRRNHTATHLLHAALRKTLGTHVKQAGSLVAPDHLRFDFTHYAALDEQELLDIEDLVNEHILKNETVATEVMDLDAAVNSGAMALFGEKYDDRVRAVSVADGSFSKELCGGTHVTRTGEIGLLKIISESSVAAGVRRIEALTGLFSLEDYRRKDETLQSLAELLNVGDAEILVRINELAERTAKLEKDLEAARLRSALRQASELVRQAREIKGVRVISARVEVTDRSTMRQMVDDLRVKLQSGVIVLGSVADEKVSLVAAVSKDLTDRLDAGKIVKAAAAIVEGTGGGRKDLAEAGGRSPAKLEEALQAVPSIIERML
jgi:alanyl-tRNA synthetase